jgi:hypothetical protein
MRGRVRACSPLNGAEIRRDGRLTGARLARTVRQRTGHGTGAASRSTAQTTEKPRGHRSTPVRCCPGKPHSGPLRGPRARAGACIQGPGLPEGMLDAASARFRPFRVRVTVRRDRPDPS